MKGPGWVGSEGVVAGHGVREEKWDSFPKGP